MSFSLCLGQRQNSTWHAGLSTSVKPLSPSRIFHPATLVSEWSSEEAYLPFQLLLPAFSASSANLECPPLLHFIHLNSTCPWKPSLSPTSCMKPSLDTPDDCQMFASRCGRVISGGVSLFYNTKVLKWTILRGCFSSTIS